MRKNFFLTYRNIKMSLSVLNDMTQSGILMNKNGDKISKCGSKFSDMTGLTTQTADEVEGGVARP